MTDKYGLEILIKKKGLTKTEVANLLGLSYQGFENKLNNCSEFKASEIYKLSVLLNIEIDNPIFFDSMLN